MAPTAALSTTSGSDSVLRIPWAAATRRNSGHGPGPTVDGISTTLTWSNAARHGPSPVSYWAWSTSGAVASVNTAVRLWPSTGRVMPHRSAGSTASTVRYVTRSSVCWRLPSPTKKRESAARLAVSGESAMRAPCLGAGASREPLSGEGRTANSSGVPPTVAVTARRRPGSRRSARGDAVVDREDRPVDAPSLVGGDEGHEPGDLVGRRHRAGDHVAGHQLAVDAVRDVERGRNGRVGGAGGHGVHPQPGLQVLHRQGPGQLHDRALGHAVG